MLATDAVRTDCASKERQPDIRVARRKMKIILTEATTTCTEIARATEWVFEQICKCDGEDMNMDGSRGPAVQAW